MNEPGATYMRYFDMGYAAGMIAGAAMLAGFIGMAEAIHASSWKP